MNNQDPAFVQLVRDEVSRVLNGLSERESQIIRLRFGMVDGRTWSLEEVGQEFGVTRERVRQIEARSLSKLTLPGNP
jgi:RNA polymerase primary sigma factor